MKTESAGAVLDQVVDQSAVTIEATSKTAPEVVTRTESVAPGFTEREESTQETSSILSTPSLRERFSTMSEKGKKFAHKVYEGIYKIPGVNRLVGKLEAGTNQIFIDRHEKVAAKLKGRVDALDIKYKAIEDTKKQISDVLNKLNLNGTLGAEKLQLKLKDLERDQSTLLNKKDRIQSKFEARDEKIKIFTEKRDAVADKLIDHYGEKLPPIEKRLENMEARKDKLELLTAATEIKHFNKLAELKDIEKQKQSIEKSMSGVGISDREIRKTVQVLSDQIETGRKLIADEKIKLEEKRLILLQSIAKVKTEINPYKDRREEFIRIKNRKNISFAMHGRERTENYTAVEQAPHIQELPPLSSLISQWNEFIKLVSGGNSSEIIDQVDFLEKMDMGGDGFQPDDVLDAESFKRMLGLYYKQSNRLSEEEFSKNIDSFLALDF